MATLSILVPVHNESATLARLLERLLSVSFPLESEVIVVDDGSNDGSDSIISQFETEGRIRSVRHSRNLGKGAAVRTALQLAKGQFVVVQDADLELDPHDLPRLLAPLISGETEVCYGSRFLNSSQRSIRMGPTIWANRLLNALCNVLNGLDITDFNTCYKMMALSVMQRLDLKENGFAMEPEITTKLARLKYRIVERPIAYSPRSRKDGKKIRSVDFFRYLSALVRYRFVMSMGDSPDTAASQSLSTPTAT